MSDERDDWGFTEAEQAEFHALFEKHRDSISALMLALMDEDGVTPMPEDGGIAGLLAEMTPPEARTKIFPMGGLWRSLFERLRELDKGDQ